MNLETAAEEYVKSVMIQEEYEDLEFETVKMSIIEDFLAGVAWALGNLVESKYGKDE